MKKFINFLILFALFITKNYIAEDWSWYTKLGKIYYYPFWLIRSILVWVFCPIFLPEYFFKKSEIYGESKKIIDSPEFQKRISTFKIL
jgi:hypothetical protein